MFVLLTLSIRKQLNKARKHPAELENPDKPLKHKYSTNED